MIQITEEQREEIMIQLCKDYDERELLKPQNNREYWLFTEVYQRLTDIFEKHRMSKARQDEYTNGIEMVQSLLDKGWVMEQRDDHTGDGINPSFIKLTFTKNLK